MPRKRRFNIYRDGLVHVQARMCATCIYRPDSPLYDVPIKAAAAAAETAVVCHSTLDTRPKQNAVCAGFYRHDKTLPLILAEATDKIKFVG